jgi:monoamine oxidase
MASHDDILIIGAGVAGLAAAADLTRAGLQVVILEARDRIGGRICTRHDPLCPIPIELGAEFIHGAPHEIFDVIHASRLLAVSVTGSHLCYRCGKLADCSDWFDSVDALLGKLNEAKQRDDESFDQFLGRIDANEETKLRASDFVEGFNAARRDTVSVYALARQQEAEEASGADRMFRLAAGYDTIAKELYRSIPPELCRLYLNTPVDQIEWRRDEVRAGRFTAQRAIVALPLGVLKSGSVRVHPEPSSLRAGIDALEMGNAVRIVFRFRECFWDQRGDLARMSFLHGERQSPFAVWWSSTPFHAPILTAWAAGPKAEQCDIADALNTLATLLGVDRSELEDQLEATYFHDWQSDPFACGAYSYVRAGKLPDADRLSDPIDDTLYFAGEHTDTTGNWGTVHGAIASGRRAARQVLRV